MGKSKRKGLFIVLEGIDGSGTTTQAALTLDWLRERGELAHGTREPTFGPVGSLLRGVLGGRFVARPAGGRAQPTDPAVVALLFAADRLDHVQNEIAPHLEAGRHVVCDRYVLSSLAYQSVDVDLPFVRAVNAKAPPPDVTFFLRVKPEVAMDRIAASRFDQEVFENLPFQRKVAKTYEDLLVEYRDGRVEIIDGEEPEHAVRSRIRTTLEELL
ncbi:MAG: dTMP kinase [Myxococcota bacterium]